MGTFTSPDNLYKPAFQEVGWDAAINTNFDVIQAKVTALGAGGAPLPSYTFAGLPAAGTAGRLARVSDSTRGIWMDNGTAWRRISGPVNVLDFGADPTGATDSYTAIQQAIDSTVGDVRNYSTTAITSFTQNPATLARYPTASVYIPAGTYLVSKRLRTKSTRGLIIEGAGMGATKLVATANMDTMLDLDGFAWGEVNGIRFSGNGTAVVTKGVDLHWSGGGGGQPAPVGEQTASSTYMSSFKNVLVEGNTLNCQIGWAVGTDNTYDVSDCTWYSCMISGGQLGGLVGGTAGGWLDAKWQYGMKFGNDSSGNVLNHHLIDCRVMLYKRGVAVTGSSIAVFGGEIQHNEVDFYHAGAQQGPFTITGVRSEHSTRLYDGPGANSNAGVVTFQSCLWTANNLATDGYVVRYHNGGALVLNNVQFTGTENTTTQPVVLVGHATVGSTVLANGIVCDNTNPQSFIGVTGLGDYQLVGYTQRNGADASTTRHVSQPLTDKVATLTFQTNIVGGNASRARIFRVVATNNTNITFTNVLDAWTGTEIIFDILNSSGGAMGTINFAAEFKAAGALTAPANGKRRTINFYHDGTNWVETNRAATDIG